MSLKTLVTRTKRREEQIAKRKPWNRLRYGKLDALWAAENSLLRAVRQNPERFSVERDPGNPEFVLITTPCQSDRGQRLRAQTVRLPVRKLRRMGLTHLIQGSGKNGNGHKK